MVSSRNILFPASETTNGNENIVPRTILEMSTLKIVINKISFVLNNVIPIQIGIFEIPSFINGTGVGINDSDTDKKAEIAAKKGTRYLFSFSITLQLHQFELNVFFAF